MKKYSSIIVLILIQKYLFTVLMYDLGTRNEFHEDNNKQAQWTLRLSEKEYQRNTNDVQQYTCAFLKSVCSPAIRYVHIFS